MSVLRLVGQTVQFGGQGKITKTIKSRSAQSFIGMTGLL